MKSEDSIRYTIIYPPLVSWHDDIFQRPHQLLREFARQGDNAIFANMNPDGKGIHWFAEPNLCISNDLMSTLCDRDIKSMIRNTRVVFWINQPERMRFHSLVNPDITVYDYIDEYVEEFAHWEAGFSDCLEQADVIVTTSDRLMEQTRIRYPGKTVLIRNGADVTHFSAEGLDVPEDLADVKQKHRYIVGFHGSLFSWIDYALIRDLALLRPEWGIVLVGPEYYWEELCKGVANIHFLGAKPYHELPAYVTHFDVEIIPFEVRDMTQSANPIKMYESLAAGVPIIATPIRECINLSPPIRIGRNADEFVDQIEAALKAKPSEQKVCLKIAAENSWAGRVKAIHSVLDKMPTLTKYTPEIVGKSLKELKEGKAHGKKVIPGH